MRKTFLMMVGACAMLACTSCGDKSEEKAKEFAQRFGQWVAADQLDSIKPFYPVADMADSVALTFVADSVKVQKGEQGDMYVAEFGGGKTMTFEMPKEGEPKVMETKGLFAFPADKIDFARKTGMVKDGMTDKELATNMKDYDALVQYVYDNNSGPAEGAIKNLGFTWTKEIAFMMDEGGGYYTLKNTTDKPISGSDYSVVFSHEYMGFGMNPSTSYTTQKGKDIPAGGTVRFNLTHSGHDVVGLSKIKMNKKSKEEVMASYQPKGDEYAAFKAKKAEKPEAK